MVRETSRGGVEGGGKRKRVRVRDCLGRSVFPGWGAFILVLLVPTDSTLYTLHFTLYTLHYDSVDSIKKYSHFIQGFPSILLILFVQRKEKWQKPKPRSRNSRRAEEASSANHVRCIVSLYLVLFNNTRRLNQSHLLPTGLSLTYMQPNKIN